MLKRLWRYFDKIFQLKKALSELKNEGFSKRYNEPLLTQILLIAMLMRLPSFNSLDQCTHRNSKVWKKLLNTEEVPSVFTLARGLRKSDIDGLRRFVKESNHKLRRNKALDTSNSSYGFMVAAVDGHETISSELRCCEGCKVREKTVKEEKVDEYYHQYVICQLVLCSIPVVIDQEPIGPGEGELTAGRRLIERILREQARMIDIFCFDALYLDSKLLNRLDKANKYWIAVLKQENREAYQEVDSLVEDAQPIEMKINKNREVTLWDMDGLVGWDNLDKPFRALVSKEREYKYKRVSRQKKIKVVESSQWRWLTNMPSSYPAKIVYHLAHGRWHVENRGFNDLVNNCHFDHPFHHHRHALLAMLWIISIAFNLSYAFFNRNLKCQLKDKCINSRSQLAMAIIETFNSLNEPLFQIRPP